MQSLFLLNSQLALVAQQAFFKRSFRTGLCFNFLLDRQPLSLFFLIVLFLHSAETLTHICAVSCAEKQEDFPQRGHGSTAGRGYPRSLCRNLSYLGRHLCVHDLLKGDCSLLSLFCHELQSSNSQIEEVELSDAVFAAHPGRRLVAHIGVCHPPPSLSHPLSLSPPPAAFHH